MDMSNEWREINVRIKCSTVYFALGSDFAQQMDVMPGNAQIADAVGTCHGSDG